MIVTKLSGGVGNQLFQYAAGRSLALAHQTSLSLDLTEYAHDPARRYELDAYQLASLAPFRITRQAIYEDNKLLRRLFHRNHWTIFAEGQRLDALTKFSQLTGNVYLDGHWQNQNYFIQYAQQIRDEFTLKKPLSSPLIAQLSQPSSIAVHVRRGDYANDPSVNQILRPASLTYYQQAFDLFKSRVKAAHFYIFSDDLTWAKRSFPHLSSFTFVEADLGSSTTDLELMRLCSHQIIANSSYSWWAAWLNANPQKIVIAPKVWYSSPMYKERGIIPPDWQRI